ncbi:uncharacterized protein LOC128960072 [Oppia nitens]|uniref:uncharacterized protein LOC128960072 n=1 Tax=Oppia nitens TaxID=1686743 RepID=UPI0023DCB34F|nr:uncharacterized protein LOC128960072 [Oppia nitens]
MVFLTSKLWSSHGSHGSGDHKPDNSEGELKKIYAKASTQSFAENPRYPMHPTSGVMPMSIVGRFKHERERLGPDFDNVQREWRIKTIHDRHLHPSEPFEVKQLYNEYHNPIRRFYRWPLDQFEDWLRRSGIFEKFIPGENQNWPKITRQLMGGGFLIYLSVLGVWYYMKYNREHWEKYRGPQISFYRETIFPGDPRFPAKDIRTESWQHYDKGFHNRKVFLNNDQQ